MLVIWAAIGLSALVVFVWIIRKGGKDAVKADIGEANAKAAERIARAGERAPDSLSELRKRLRDGGEL